MEINDDDVGFHTDVSEADFEFEVLAYSQNVPVVVDFWAEWCRPCKDLDPLLEKITREAGGAFRLARVDVDRNPNLALRFGVRSLPMVKVFSSSEIVAEFVGMQPSPFTRVLRPAAAPSPAALTIEKETRCLLPSLARSRNEFPRGASVRPDHPEGLLGLSKGCWRRAKGTKPIPS